MRTRWHVLCFVTSSYFCCAETSPQYSIGLEILLQNLGYRGGRIVCALETCIPVLCLLRHGNRAQRQ